MDKLKKSRSSARQHATKMIAELNREMCKKEPNYELLDVKFERLTEISEAIINLYEDILELIASENEEVVVRDIEIADNYRDEFLTTRTKVKNSSRELLKRRKIKHIRKYAEN